MSLINPEEVVGSTLQSNINTSPSSDLKIKDLLNKETTMICFKIGDLVLAKMRGFPYWPGLISEPSKAKTVKLKPNHFLIYFFGSKNFSAVEEKNLKHYDPAEIGNLKLPLQAKTEIEEYRKKKTSKHPIDELQKVSKPVKKSPKKSLTPRSKSKSPKKKLAPIEVNDRDFGTNLSANYVIRINSLKNSTFDIPCVDLDYLSENIWKRQISPTSLKIGFVGLGVVGSRLVRNLLKTGHNVTLWNRTEEKAEMFERIGATVANSLEELSKKTDIVFCCVSDSLAAQEVVLRLLHGIRPKSSLVNLTHTDSKTSMHFFNAVYAQGGKYLEARLIGNRRNADDGDLTLFTSGSSELHEGCTSCFKVMASKSIYISENINDAIIIASKFDMLLGVNLVGYSEIISLLKKCDFSMDTIDTVTEIAGLRCGLIFERHMLKESDNVIPAVSLHNIVAGISNALSSSASATSHPCANSAKQILTKVLSSKTRDMDHLSSFLCPKLP